MKQLILLLLLLGLNAHAQTDFSAVQIKTTHVRGNVYMLEGSGGNIGVCAGPDGLLMVDDQFAPLAEKISVALKEINPGPLRFVLNTHVHGDHTGGNAVFGQQASIVAHVNVRDRLQKSGALKGGLPVITFRESVSFHFNNEEISITHIPPAHTDNDSVVHFKSANVIHMGDQFFSGRFPNIDLGGGGDVRGYIRNVETSLKNLPPEVKLIPGHGPLSGRPELEKFLEMLKETSAIVEAAIQQGKSLPEIKTAGMPEKWKSWEAPTLKTDRWLEILYNGLRRKP